MAANAPLILKLVAASVSVSHRAGRIIRDIMTKGELAIVEKGKNDFQTEADRAGQRCIMSSLYKQFPKISMFGEEENDPKAYVDPDWIEVNKNAEVLKYADVLPENLQNIKDDEVVVWIDPLDGTAEYTQASKDRILGQGNKLIGSSIGLSLLDHVTVLIGIAVHGKAVAGVMYQPYYNYKEGPDAQLGRAIWGIIGLGSFGYDNVPAPEGQNIITTTRSHSNKTVVDAVEACEPTEILRAGGAGHKVLLILEGKAHAYVFASPGCKKWDTAAPEAILQAAGGRLTDIHGNDIQYHANVQRRNSGGVLAVPRKETHQWYLEKIPEEVKQALSVT